MIVMYQNRMEFRETDNYQGFLVTRHNGVAMSYICGETAKLIIIGQYKNQTQAGMVLDMILEAILNEEKFFQMPDENDPEIYVSDAQQHGSKVTTRDMNHGNGHKRRR